MYTFDPKTFVLSFLLMMKLGFVFSQNEAQMKIDSLKRFLRENPNSHLVQYDIAELLKDSDSAVALQYVKNGLANATKSNDLFGIGKGKYLLGNFYSDYKNPVRGEYFYRSADTLLSNLIKKDSSTENLRLWVRNTFNIGVVRSYQGFNEDVYYIEKITPIAKKIGFDEILAKGNTNIGIGFYNSEQYTKAYPYLKTGGPLHLEVADHNSYVINKLIFASCLLALDSLETAKKQLDIVKPILDSIARPERNHLYQIVKGQYFREKEEYTKAINSFSLAEEYLKKNPVAGNELQLYIDYMLTYGKMKDYDKAIEYAEQGLSLSNEFNNHTVMADIYKKMSGYKKELGKVSEALDALNNYVTITDTLNINELEKEVNRLESRYQSEKKEKEILQLKSDNDTVELQLAQKQSQNYFLLSASMGLLVLAGFTYFGYRNFKKKDQLKTAEINSLKYEQESRVYNAMLEGQENERKRLAVDLHDGLAGRLSATRLKLEKLASKTEVKSQVKGVNEAVSNIDASLSELRSIAMNLMPETLFKYGLKNAIEDYCSSIGKGIQDIKFIIQFYDSDVELPTNTSLTIYRIVQELINNAVKHSKATEVLVQYLEENDKVNITVEDNGQGFSREKASDSGGMGLNNLKNRVAYLNGEIDFYSSPEEGTTVHIVIDI